MKFVHRDQVRFRDLDGFGHVNNAVFLTYMESARTAWALEHGLMTGVDDLPLILARAEIDFRAPIELGDLVETTIWPGRIGTKSFELEHELRVDGRLVAEGKCVLVAYDYEAEQSIPLPDEWHRVLAQ
jgi:acyl-CoA thioester hydrolase